MAQYANRLKSLIDNPDSFGDTAGFKFGLNTGLDATARSNSRMRGSGNALAALAKFGTGYAMQGRGDEIDRLGRLEGQAQQYDLGAESNRLTGVRDANSLALGTRAANTADTRNANDLTLGMGALDNTRRGQNLDFGLGMTRAGNEYDLGLGQLDATNQRDFWNYDLGKDQVGTARARDQNDFNLGAGRLGLDWYGAGTNRGSARSSDFWRGREEAGRNFRDPRNVPRRIV